MHKKTATSGHFN